MQTVRTSLGPVPVWGRYDGGRPLLFVIRGAFPQADHLVSLTERLPALDVALVHLPGMHCPHIAEPGPLRFAEAFDEVLTKLGHRDVFVLGVSMGGLAAMALQTAVRRLVLLDTPLTTLGLWPAVAACRDFGRTDPEVAEWVDRLFGIKQDEVQERDYRPLLNGLKAPAVVLLGSDPLGSPRPVQRLPSLVSEADRQAYEAHPMVRVVTVPNTGHNIPKDGLATMMMELRNVSYSAY